MITTSKVILLSAFLLSVVTQLWCAPIPIISIGNKPHDDETDSSSSSEISENDKFSMGHPRVPATHMFNDLETKATIRNEVSYEPHRGQMFTPNVGSSHWTNDYKLGMRTMNKLFEEGERFDQKINYLIEKKNAYLNGKNSFKVFMIKDIGPDSNLVSDIDTHDRLDSKQNVKNITENGKILTERIFSLPFKSDITKSFENIGPGNVFHMSQSFDNGNKVLKGLLDEIKYGSILSKADPVGVEDPYRDTLLDTPIPKRIRTNTEHSSITKGHSDNFMDINVKDIGNLRESRGQSKFLIDDSDLSQGFGNDDDGEDSEDADSKASQSGAEASSEAGSKIVSDEATKEDENEDDDSEDDEDGGEEESKESKESLEREEETGKKAAESANESGEEESDEETEEEDDDDEDDLMQMKLGEPELGMGVVDEEGEDNNGSNSSDSDSEEDDDDDDDGNNGNGNGNNNCVNGNFEDGCNGNKNKDTGGYNGNKNEDTGGSDSDDDDDDEIGNGNGDDDGGEIDDDNGDDEEEEDDDESEQEEDEEEEEGALKELKVRKNATTVTIRLRNNGRQGQKSASAKSTDVKDSKNGEKSRGGVHKIKIKAKLNGHNGKAGKSKSKGKKIKFSVKIKNGKGMNGKEAEESEENEEEGEGEESFNGDDDNGDEDDDSDEENGNGDNDEEDNGDDSDDEENGDDENGEEDNDDEDDDDEDEDEGEDSDGDNNNGDNKCKTIKIKSGTKLICTSDGDISLPTVSDQDEDDNDNGAEKLIMADIKKHIEMGKDKRGTWFARKKTKPKAQKKKSVTIKVTHAKKGNKHRVSIKQKAPKTKSHSKRHNHKHGIHLNITTKMSKKDDPDDLGEKFTEYDKDAPDMMKSLFMTNITITNSSAGLRNTLGNDDSNESAESTKTDDSKPQSTKSPSPLASYKIVGEKPPLKITMNISKQKDTSAQGDGEGIEKEFNPSEIDSFIKQLKSVYDDDDDFIMFLMKLLKKELRSRLSKN